MALGERSQPAVVWTVEESGGMGLEMRARRRGSVCCAYGFVFNEGPWVCVLLTSCAIFRRVI